MRNLCKHATRLAAFVLMKFALWHHYYPLAASFLILVGVAAISYSALRR